MISTPRFSRYGFIVVYGEKLKDGRWAYTEIPLAKDGNPGLIEPDVYGKLRPRWNTNDRACVRFMTARPFLIYS